MGASLPKPVLDTVIERRSSKSFRVAVAEINGWRNSMEDAHVVHMEDDCGYFGVLDGHGGSVCSAWCAKKLQERLAADGCPADDSAAKELVHSVDAAFLETEQRSGSTAAMCIVRPPSETGGKHKIHVINAGDSRVLLSHADGSIIDGGGTDKGLTTDHKPDHPSERERIYRCGGTVVEAAGGVHRVNGDLAVSRGFGDAEYKKTGGPRPEDRPVTCDPEQGHFECDATDFVLVVCDGVSEGDFSNPEVCKLAAEVLADTGDPGKACEAVVHRAVECNSKDNISCMMILMTGESDSANSAASKEFIPGCLLGSDNSAFVTAMAAMCERGGVTLAEAAEQRFATVSARQGTSSEQPDDSEELAHIGIPDGDVGTAERAKWFVEWAENRQNGNDGGSSGGGGGATDPMAMINALQSGGPQDRMAMMAMVQRMMSGGGPYGGPEEPDDGRLVRVADIDNLREAVAAVIFHSTPPACPIT